MGKVIIGYEKAPSDVILAIDKVMLLHHKDLCDAGVTLQVLMVHKYDKNDELAPAMMVRGHVALAKTSITSHIDRARGLPDAKLVIDAEYGWSRLAEGRREALIHGELLRLAVVTEEQIESEVTVVRPKLDDCGRPRLKMVHPDILITGFNSALELYGEASVESQQIKHFCDEHGQYDLFKLVDGKKGKAKG